jgi:molybdate transport system substrate-binding protein
MLQASILANRRAAAVLLLLAGAWMSAWAAGCGSRPAEGGVTVAVAANFLRTAEELAARSRAGGGPAPAIVSGSTGGLYAQIRNGAPFDVLLAADQLRPRLLEEQGLAVAGTRFTYALGRLVLCGRALREGADGGALLASGDYGTIAVASPDTAPYGAAALEVLGRLGVDPDGRMVTAGDVGQALHHALSGASDLAFVALAQWNALEAADKARLPCWPVPETLHAPIRQDAVLLEHGARNAAARRFLDLLRGPEGAALVRAAGYDRPDA